MTENYSIPKDLRVYAIGDVHGYLDALKAMHDLISDDLLKSPVENAHIVYLGDYIDRGPDSRGVIEYLIERQGRADGVAKTFLMGNHEVAGFEEFMKDPVGHDWLRYGGLTTLASYGISFENERPIPAEVEALPERMRAMIPEAHFAFYRGLELSVEIGGYVFVHAGVDPMRPMEEQTRKEFTRMRQPFLSWHEHPEYRPLPKRVVHGHTITPEVEVLPHRINVDTGLYEHGVLTAAVIEGEDVRFLQVKT